MCRVLRRNASPPRDRGGRVVAASAFRRLAGVFGFRFSGASPLVGLDPPRLTARGSDGSRRSAGSRFRADRIESDCDLDRFASPPQDAFRGLEARLAQRTRKRFARRFDNGRVDRGVSDRSGFRRGQDDSAPRVGAGDRGALRWSRRSSRALTRMSGIAFRAWIASPGSRFGVRQGRGAQTTVRGTALANGLAAVRGDSAHGVEPVRRLAEAGWRVRIRFGFREGGRKRGRGGSRLGFGIGIGLAFAAIVAGSLAVLAAWAGCA